MSQRKETKTLTSLQQHAANTNVSQRKETKTSGQALNLVNQIINGRNEKKLKHSRDESGRKQRWSRNEKKLKQFSDDHVCELVDPSQRKETKTQGVAFRREGACCRNEKKLKREVQADIEDPNEVATKRN